MRRLSNIWKFNLFVYFTMLAKFSVELFLPVILYKLNYSIKSIFIFLILTFFINILISIPASLLGRKIGFKYLLLASSILFTIMYFIVTIMKKNIVYFIVVAFLNSATNILYYISRHNYAGLILDKNIARKVGGFLIVTVLASISASLLSGLLIKERSIILLAIIITTIYLIGIFFIFKIKEIRVQKKCTLKYVSSKIPIDNKIFFCLNQFKTIFFYLYPVYLYIFVDNSYTYISLVYIVTGLASIIFIYYFSRRIANGYSNYLRNSSILLSLTLLLDMFVFNKFLALIIVFLEGIFIKLYETSVTNNMYSMKGNLECSSYFLFMEILYNVSRIVILTLFLILNINLRTSLFYCIVFIFFSGFIKFQNKKATDVALLSNTN